MNHINEYYITVGYENHFCTDDMFFFVIDALNDLHIPYKREMYSDFRNNGEDFDRITRIYLCVDFDTLFKIIKKFYDNDRLID